MNRSRLFPYLNQTIRLIVVFTLLAGLISTSAAQAANQDTTADRVLGQADFTSVSFNRGGEPAANTLALPIGVAIDHRNQRLYISDNFNHRILSWPNAADFTNGQAADMVIGQANFTSRNVNRGLPSSSPITGNMFNYPSQIAVDQSGNLYVADTNNHRILVFFDPAAPGSDTTADMVFGQAGDFTTNIQNKGGLSADSLNFPVAVAVDSQGNLYVSDYRNNRVLIYNTPLVAGGDTTADRVIGQADFTHNNINRGMAPAANTLADPYGLALDSSDDLYVADNFNHRVLKFNQPLLTDLNADLVLGQASFTVSLPNRGNGSPAEDTLVYPQGVAMDPYGNLFVADYGNSRILKYTPPFTDGQPADLVFGQADFNSGNSNRGGAASEITLYYPSSLALDLSGNLYTTDTNNNRLLEFDTPVANPAPALTSLSKTSAAAGEPGFTLTVNGSSFGPQTVVRWNGAGRPTTYISINQLSVEISATDLAAGSSVSVTAFTPAPGGGESNSLAFTVNNPAPGLTALSNTSATAGGIGFTLTITGSNFVSTSAARWNGETLSTTYVNTTTLSAQVPASKIASAGSASVTVFNPAPAGGESSALSFAINNPVPGLAGLGPSEATAGGDDFTLLITGTNFVMASVVRWNGAPLTTTYISATSLTAQVPASKIALAGSGSLTVFNPAPEGGESSALSFAINNPVPTLTGLGPSKATAGGNGFTLLITGTNFINASVVRWNGAPLATTFTSAASLTAQVPASKVASAGSANVTVFNPAPSGGESSAYSFTINNPIPTLSGLGPSKVTAGGLDFTLHITGTNFISASVVRWNGTPLPTTYISATSLDVQVTAAQIASAGEANITIYTPGPGGGVSSAAKFTIEPRLLNIYLPLVVIK